MANVEDEEDPERVARNEAAIFGDDQVVRVYIKIRDAIAEVNDEFETRLKHLKGQLAKVEAELMQRLHDRGATQTKTTAGTAFLGETMQVTIADDVAYGDFVLREQDPSYYQKRAKVERVKEYMDAHDGELPPGVNVFRRQTINVRQPRKARQNGTAASDNDSGTDERSGE